MKAAVALVASACLGLLVPSSAWGCMNSMNEHRKPIHVADAFEIALREANAALSHGDYKKAKTRAQFATSAHDPAIAVKANRTLGLAALKLGNFDEASRALELANKNKPTPIITARLAEAELGAGRTERAAMLLEQLAGDGVIPDADGFVALAKARLAKANKEGALAAVRGALAMNAQHDEALALKAQLEGEAPPARPEPARVGKRAPKRAAGSWRVRRRGRGGARGGSQRRRAILEQHECHRCHVVDAVAPPPMARNCAGCHRDISSAAGDKARIAAGTKEYGRANFQRFMKRTGGLYCNVPALTGMDRFRAEWLTTFLTAPYDVRPNVAESMPRHNLSGAEIAALVTAWRAKPTSTAPPVRPSSERLAKGAKVFESAGCGLCHLYGNRTFEVSRAFGFEFAPRNRLRALAPDLRHARDRLNRDTIERTIRDPKSVNPGAEMPKLKLGDEDLALVVDFVMFGEAGAASASTPPAPPPYDPKAPVPTYAEVERKVFKQVCWHCHSDPDFNDGDGGPGNSGGFGFPGIGLSFADWVSVMNGSVDAKGKPRSILRKGRSGEAVLLERLRLRYAENERDHVLPGQDDLKDRRVTTRSDLPRGMPLGLPALTPEQFSLVERWVKGGAPGP